MSLLAEYQDARHEEDTARLRRVIALRAMAASGMSHVRSPGRWESLSQRSVSS
jgi:hypothetical protein